MFNYFTSSTLSTRTVNSALHSSQISFYQIKSICANQIKFQSRRW